MNQSLLVPFHGENLIVVDYNNEPYVAMKPIVDGMGLAWQSQLEKIKQRFNSTVTEIVMVASDGKKRNMICLPLRKLAGWLYSIYPNKVKEELREKIIRYQEECDEVLWQYWSKGIAIKEKIRASIEAYKEQDSESFHRSSPHARALAMRGVEKRFFKSQISYLEDRLRQPDLFLEAGLC